ncbi:hypothetical protein BGX27_002403 [Mortierella sp. AM989]|nr:hypothetical protein BGX27_002403 [Mortierella sp. AM989]
MRRRKTIEEPEAPTAQRRKKDGDSNLSEEDELEGSDDNSSEESGDDSSNESEDDSSDEFNCYKLSDYDEDYEDDGLSDVDDFSISSGEVSEDD